MPRNKSNKKKNKNKSQKQNKQLNEETTDQNSPSEDQPCVNNQQDGQAENLADVETIKVEDQQQVENPVILVETETTEVEATTNKEESVVETEEGEISNLKSVEEEPVENESIQGEQVVKQENTQDLPSKKKRFSFFKKNKKSSSVLNVTTGSGMDQMKKNKSNSEGVTVQRAQSLSTFDREPKSRIPLHKFRSEKKKNSNLTASTSNVDSTSLVLNPGMDDWRMSGLLNNVRNKDSVPSLTLAPSNSNPQSSTASQNHVKTLNEETENTKTVSLLSFLLLKIFYLYYNVPGVPTKFKHLTASWS